MLYEKISGRIVPYREDESYYYFRYFCDADPPPQVPREPSIPKSLPEFEFACTGCGAQVRVQMDQIERPFLDSTGGPHFAAVERKGI
jgi:hypothetical protein